MSFDCCPEASLLLREVENQLGIEIRSGLIIKYLPFKEGRIINLFRTNGQAFEYEIKMRNIYLPECEIILISDFKKIFVAHERLHAEIYRPDNFTPKDKNTFLQRLQCYFIETRETILRAILNYFQDISVNGHLFQILQQRHLEGQYPKSLFLKRLCEEITPSLDELSTELNQAILTSPQDQKNLRIRIIEIAMAILNYSVISGERENNLVQKFQSINEECRMIYQELNQFTYNILSRERWPVGREDYENLLRLIQWFTQQ